MGEVEIHSQSANSELGSMQQQPQPTPSHQAISSHQPLPPQLP
jgi:hypothetical protein